MRAQIFVEPGNVELRDMTDARAVEIRPIEAGDQAAILALNNEHAVELSPADESTMAGWLSVAALATAIGAVGAPDAFLIAFDESTPSQGPNHAWFLARHPRFLYVDRVCVAPSARKRGLARALYLDLFAAASRRGAPVVCCEVNTDPPNPVSDAFHASLQFREVGRAFLADRSKAVRYLERGA
jgi:predicted GNAT superfamily acetyltransferase